ncbi:MAG: hypothetical protein HY367_02650, partial [Candidatus Aenigmarchaeota archaeon]|nr:hypothetical protein [Candidatus Aenigmarchaeota archaeon]
MEGKLKGIARSGILLLFLATVTAASYYIVLVLGDTVDSITINSPANNTFTANNTPAFSFNVSGNNTLYNTTLTIGGVLRGENASTYNNTNTTIQTNATLGDGNYTWYVNVTNQSVSLSQSESRVIVIDTITPFLVINRTELNLTILRNDSGLLINISVNDTNRNNTGVLAQGNGTTPSNVSFTIISGSFYQVNTTPGAMGCNIDSNCTIRFFGRDLALNTNATETLSIGVDNTNPAVSGAITNVSIVRNASSVRVNVTVTDGYSISTVLVGNNSNVTMASVGGNVFQA